MPDLHPAFQPYGGQVITCSSNDGRRNYCNADTRGGVRLSRQISGSACVQGQTWGYDRGTIWVDRGCRAEFVLGQGGGGGGYPPQIITCSSDDGRRNFCNADTRGGVRLNRQISGSACIQGQTLGLTTKTTSGLTVAAAQNLSLARTAGAAASVLLPLPRLGSSPAHPTTANATSVP